MSYIQKTERVICYNIAIYQTFWFWLDTPKGGEVKFEGNLILDFTARRDELHLADFRLPTWLVIWEPFKQRYRAYLGLFLGIKEQNLMAWEGWTGVEFYTYNSPIKVPKNFEEWNPWEQPDWRPNETIPEDYYSY